MENRLVCGDIIELKKGHPCGANRWEVVRTGVDFKLKCAGCGHVVMLPREKLFKMVRRVVSREEK